MKILKKYDTLIFYNIDIGYLKKNADIISSQHSSSHWAAQSNGSLRLQYDLFFEAHSHNKDDYFIKYHSRLELECLIEDIDSDSEEVLNYKEISNISTQLFLMQNTKGYYHLLNFREMNFSN